MSTNKLQESIISTLKDAKIPLYSSELEQKIKDKLLYGYERENLLANIRSTLWNYTEGKNKKNSQIQKIRRDFYILQKYCSDYQTTNKVVIENDVLVEVYGLHWSRRKIDWNSKNGLLGYSTDNQQEIVDMRNQNGIYILYYDGKLTYVGKAVREEKALFQRLKEHVKKSDKEPWDAFSWFGFNKVENGKVLTSLESVGNIVLEELAYYLESILMLAINPRKNISGTTNFKAKEYFQLIEE